MDEQNLNNPTEKLSPKHVFLHLFVIIMLYAATINFLTLIFQYINVWVRDYLAEAGYESFSGYYNLIRFALASFIVVFPVFILVSRYLNKSYLKNSAIKDMKIRKWLIYFTLFTAALIIIGDLVKIVFVFLNGEITLRFILKALAVLIVTGIIFRYYLWDIKKEKSFTYHKYFVLAIIILAFAGMIAGFFIIGSPQKERLRRFDQQKIGDLSGAQSQIVEYWRTKERLPQNLIDLENKISGYRMPNDPQTKEPYEYNVKGENSFELCAIFNLDFNLDSEGGLKESPPILLYSDQNWNWEYKKGKTCFERIIDKELYPPYSKEKILAPKPLD